MKLPLFFLLAASCCIAFAQKPFKTKTVSVFKNGSGFFTKEAVLPTEAGSYFLEGSLPKAAFGTLWFTSPSGELKEVRKHILETSETKEVTNNFRSSDFRLMLGANLQKTLTLNLSTGEKITGKVERLDGDFFILNTGTEWVNLQTGTIKQIAFASQPNYPDSTHTETKTYNTSKNGFLLKFGTQKASQPMEMMYLEKGIVWKPTYHLDIQDDDKADLVLQAVVVNDAEDIEDATLQFVVGVPNFVYANELSPLAYSTDLTSFLNGFQNPQQQQVRDFANRGGSSIAYGINIESDQTGTQGAALQGSSTEDLFFYSLPKVTLKKGHRAFFTVLQAEVPIQHIYEVRLEANNADTYYRNNQQRDGFSFEENFKNKVWHTLKLKNITNMPMTAGAVMVTKTTDGQKRPISQDKITYTPSQGETFLKLTAAPDVSVRDAEKEVSREAKVRTISGYHYDRLTIEGEIRLHNYKGKAIDLNVRRQISGELKESDPKWLTAPRVPVHGQFNEVTDVCWELKLKAGEKKTVSYQYTILVRHR